MKKYFKIAFASLLSFTILGISSVNANAMTTYHQHSSVFKANGIIKADVQPDSQPNEVVNNPFGVPDFAVAPFQTTPDYQANHVQNNAGTLNGNLVSSNPNIPINFTTESYLPTTLSKNNGDLSHPQALAVTPDGNTAFVSIVSGKNDGNGRIVKYNLGDLNNRFHTNANGSMGLIRSAGLWNHRVQKSKARLKFYKNKYKSAKKRHKRVAYCRNKYKWAKIDLKQDQSNVPSKNYVNLCTKNYRAAKKAAAHSKSQRTRKALKKTARKLKNAKRSYRQNKSSSKHSVNTFKAILKDIQVGPQFYTGHGQTIAYNPADGNLWYLNYDGQKFVEKIDPNSLAPQTKLDLDIDPGQNIGHSFAFDNAGHAWFWSTTSNNSVGIYEGIMSPDKIQFTLKKRFQNGPGRMQQASAFDSHSNRFFLAADGSLMSVKIDDNGNVDSDNVQNTWIQGKRETEGLSFDNAGNSYLLVNRGPEILQTSDYINH